jgi:hypothetical protein
MHRKTLEKTIARTAEVWKDREIDLGPSGISTGRHGIATQLTIVR